MWYALIGDEQVGPVDANGMLALRGQRRVDASTYVWREGMADWVPLQQAHELLRAMNALEPEDIDELDESEVRGEDEAATVMMDNDQGKDWASYLESLAQQSTPIAPTAPPAESARPDSRAPTAERASAPPPALQSSPRPVTSQPAPQPAAPAAQPATRTGSLSPQATRPGPAPAPASSRRAPSPTPEPEPPVSRRPPPDAPAEIDFASLLEPDLGAPTPAPVAPTSLGAQKPTGGGSKFRIWMVLLPILGATAAAVVLWVRHAQQSMDPPPRAPTSAPATEVPVAASVEPTQAPATQPPTAAPTVAVPDAAVALASAAGSAPATVPPTVAGTAAPATAPPTAAATAAPVTAPPTSAPTAAPAAPTAAAPKPPPPKPAPTRPPPPPPPVTAPAGDASKTLTRNDIMGVVNASMGGLKGCGEQQADLKGTLSVATSIERDGSVSAAQVTTAKFRGTPVGTCIEAKIKALRFPKFGGDPIRFNLPLNL